MPGEYGEFEYRGRAFLFEEASCQWRSGELFVDAQGKRCGLRFVGVPFPNVAEIAQLPGKFWDPDDEALARHADTFAEGGLQVRDQDLWIMSGRIECRRHDEDRGVLTVSFRLQVQNETHGRQDEADGVVHCRVKP